MNKSITHSFDGMMMDTTQSKFSNKFYFEGRNIRILATNSQSTGSITNEKGNSFILTIPRPVIDYLNKIITYDNKTLSYITNEINYSTQSGDQIIIGHSTTRDYIILLTTDNSGFDCIWKMDYDTYNIELLYLRNMEFSINYPIQVLNNFENEIIDKIYWIDGKSQIKFINIKHSILNGDLEELIDLPSSSIQFVCDFKLSQPLIVNKLPGGNHTAGMIQYAYNLYRINSSQSKISPLSELIPLDKDLAGGGNLNENVSTIPILNINSIDDNYTHIKIYSIKYTSYDQIPTISLISDQIIPFSRNVEYFDDGGIIKNLSMEEFLYLGSDIIFPKHISSKFNRLFSANYKEINFNVDLDMRAYSFNSLNISTVYNELFLNTTNPLNHYPDGTSYTIVNDIDYENPILKDHDAVNLNYNSFKFQKDGITYGGEGKYIKYELTQDLVNNNNRFFKDDEIYRIGIQFYNKYGQTSLPLWIADFKSRNGNLNGLYNTLKITLKPEFYIWLNINIFNNEYEIPSGYKILLAERNYSDRTIVTSGIVSSMMINDKSGVSFGLDVNQLSRTLPKIPNFLIRNVNTLTQYGLTAPLVGNLHTFPMNVVAGNFNTEVQLAYYADKDTSGRLFQFTGMMQLYSPEVIFKDSVSLTDGLKFKVKGSFKNTFNSSWGQTFDPSTGIGKYSTITMGGISPFYSPYLGDGMTFAYGLIGHTPDPNGNLTNKILFNREYGNPLTLNNSINTTNAISFQNIPVHSTLSNNDNTNPNITLLNANKEFKVMLDNVYSKSTISFEIIPDVGFTTVVYSTSICRDILTTNILSNLNLVTGTNTITFSETFTPTFLDPTFDFSYFLNISSGVHFKGKINVTISCGTVPTPIQLQKESLNNIFDINNVSGLTTNAFTPASTPVVYDIYGSPEMTELGQDFKSYNNDAKYRYTNSLQSVMTDGNSSWDDDGLFGRRIVTINSNNNRCVTMVLGDDNLLTDHLVRPTLEQVAINSGINSGDDNCVIGELIKSDIEIYLGSIYGGNSYEDKKRTVYVEIGEFKDIVKTNTSSINYIISPGDTFVHNFKFERIVRTDIEITATGTFQICEIVNYLTETTIDLKNRNDLSLKEWNVKFQPFNNEFHKYNKVYSQLSNLITTKDLDFNIKKINHFDTNVITTKLKSPGELIDSWTDFLPNEILTLDGKYGSINSLINFNDELYTIQDKALAFISISPRVQVQGSDGVAVQLGTGSILDRYKYLSTEYGTLNKWSVVTSPSGLYFFDLLNKSFNVFKGSVVSLSTDKQMHHYFNNNIDLLLKTDNPLIKQGISAGYDLVNNDVFMTFLQDGNNYTISYNERKNNFISFYDYLPSIYISKGDYFITTSPNNKSIYRQYHGEYNKFYDIYHPSSFVLNVNPESNNDCVFDNINFKSEVTLNNVDQVDKTLTGIRAYNDHQDSNSPTTLTPLIVGRNNNLRRKFRDWNALIPRDGRNRIRAPYIKLKLQFDNTLNYKLIFHDISIYYTV